MSSKRHHFVPQGYLRGFATNEASSKNLIWVYDKRPNRRPEKKSIRSVAHLDAYYAQENIDGSEDFDTIEKMLAQTIENDVPLILSKINSKAGETVVLSNEDKEKLAFFIGLSMTRVPSIRDGINECYSQLANLLISTSPQSKAYLNEHNLKAEAKPWVSLPPMFEMAKKIAETILKNNWLFFIPLEKSFITSDNPACFLSKFGPAHPETMHWMSLRSDLAFYSSPEKFPNMQVFNYNISKVDKFNDYIASAARHCIFANYESPELDILAKKHFGSEQRIIG